MSNYKLLQDYLTQTEAFLSEKQLLLQQELSQIPQKEMEEIERVNSLLKLELAKVSFLTRNDLYQEMLFALNFNPPNVSKVKIDLHNSMHEFPNILRKSIFMMSYAAFESNLQKICINTNINPKIKVSDLIGKGIEQSKDYLEKIIGLDLSKSIEWNSIKSYNKLRNCLSHNGVIKGCKDETYLIFYISQNGFLDFQSNEIIFKKGFCEKCIASFEVFESYINHQLKEKLNPPPEQLSFAKWLFNEFD